MRLHVEVATAQHAHDLAPRLRDQDLAEIRATSGEEPLAALLHSLRVSDPDMVWAALEGDETVALFGANRITHRWGGIWLLGSEGIRRNKAEAWQIMRAYLAEMHLRYEVLTNFIDVRNTVSLAWLERLGFVPLQAIPDYGVEGRLFIQYASHREEPHV